jgi:hypothetical protein
MLPQPVSLALACLTFGTSFVSGCVLSCAALWDRTNMKVLPISGIARTLLGASLVLAGVWGMVPHPGDGDGYMISAMGVLGLAIAVAGIATIIVIYYYLNLSTRH